MSLITKMFISNKCYNRCNPQVKNRIEYKVRKEGNIWYEEQAIFNGIGKPHAWKR